MKDLDYHVPQQRTISTQGMGPVSSELDARRQNAVARALSPGLPGYVVAADGGVLVDADGNSFIDFASGIAVTSVGASNQRVAAAVAEAAAQFTHTCFMISPYESYIAVCEKLAELTPGDHAKKSALFNSGAEAVENAVKVARSYTGKNAVAVFDRAYHGRTNLTLAMTAKNKPYKTLFGPFASDVYRVPSSYPLHDGLTGPEAAERTIKVLEQEIGAENLACVVIEPIQGEGGFVVPAEGYLPALVEWCRKNNVVFVADEVQAGFCRSGEWFSVDHEGVVPDVVATAKGIAGGMPLSAVTGRADIMDAPIPGALGGTYGGNPVACAAALAAIEEMETHDLAGRAREMETIIRRHLEPLLELDVVREVRGHGAMIAVELVDGEITGAVAAACKAAGVLILTCGLDGNVIRLLPALTIPENLLVEGLEIMAEAINTQAKERA
ncbi:4-aminobutyrate--2-oxoglutarate transaminase [Corynebacterium frankenforstense]|uniref:4-aminobutyrate--2-oxoglutarate transaminase n=1 Tax=Corynebacterium TaxID=1716 RepID=UPI00254B92E3|nr:MULTISPECIES: 4-aminobutyrate--2-oxoglutarate transaminase [Corynebacterium]MDK6259618.1 4-aminobutyrate--2-oxoglutarate transaminase [Corynebacterium frankenforstense]MDK8894816.1 4-aminobutyrate--2-oxoglutarate transaminase [Corynebacterium sp. MSK006]